MVSALFLVTLGFFGAGGSFLIAGIVTQSSVLTYTSIGVSSLGLALACYLCARDRRRLPTFENPAYAPRLYNMPGMKKNKSDTDLELIGAPKNTPDDGNPA